MKVLVAGGGGYVGSHVAWYLLRGGHVPVVLDNWSGGRPDKVEGIEVITADAADRSKTRAAFEHFQFDALVFAVTPTTLPRPSRLLPELLFPTCLGSGVVLSELSARFGVERTLLLSSGDVYGRTAPDGVGEDAPISPAGLRGEVDACLERVFRGYAEAGSFSLTVLRLFTVAGAEPDGSNGEERGGERRLVPTCLKALLEDRSFTVWNDGLATPDGTAVRDYVHVLDVAEAVRLCLERPSPPRVSVYNVSSGRGLSVREVIREAEGVAERKLTLESGGTCPPVTPYKVGMNTKLQKALGWEPRHSTLRKIVRSQWGFLRRRAEEDARVPRPAQGEASSGELFGEVAVRLGFARPQDVERALKVQREDGAAGKPRRLLGLVMLQEGIITNAQLIEILRYYDRGSTSAEGESEGAGQAEGDR